MGKGLFTRLLDVVAPDRVSPLRTRSLGSTWERLRILKEKVDSISVLEQRRDLSWAQADSIAHHIETVSAQVGSAFPSETSSLLDVEVSSLVDMSTEMEIVAQTRNILSGTDVSNPQIWDDLGNKLNGKKG